MTITDLLASRLLSGILPLTPRLLLTLYSRWRASGATFSTLLMKHRCTSSPLPLSSHPPSHYERLFGHFNTTATFVQETKHSNK